MTMLFKIHETPITTTTVIRIMIRDAQDERICKSSVSKE